MAVEILLPRLGWTMEEGTFGEWLKQDGDAVAVGDLLFTVESDKALNEVEALESGILRILPDAPKTGTVIPVGTLLGYLVAAGEEIPSGQSTKSEGESPPAEDAQHEEPAPLATEPEPQAPFPAPTPVPVNLMPAPAPLSGRASRTFPTISPRAQRVATEFGVDWTKLKGSGISGRIVEKDVRAAYDTGLVKPKPIAAAAPQTIPAPQPGTASAPVQRTAIPSVRRITAQRMAESAHTTAPVTLTTEVDATELVAMRTQLQADKATAEQPTPSYTDLLVKLCAHALGEHPALNARLDGDEIVVESAAHIGIAVDTERGLLVPVLRNVGTKTVRQIAAESKQLVERARAGKLTGDELRGGTFTITNLGMYEIDAFTPIINLPECAILGVGRIVPKPIVIDGAQQVAVRQMMFLSLTFDHRLVDGAPAARFLQRVKTLIEKPYLWLVA